MIFFVMNASILLTFIVHNFDHISKALNITLSYIPLCFRSIKCYALKRSNTEIDPEQSFKIFEIDF